MPSSVPLTNSIPQSLASPIVVHIKFHNQLTKNSKTEFHFSAQLSFCSLTPTPDCILSRVLRSVFSVVLGIWVIGAFMLSYFRTDQVFWKRQRTERRNSNWKVAQNAITLGSLPFGACGRCARTSRWVFWVSWSKLDGFGEFFRSSSFGFLF